MKGKRQTSSQVQQKSRTETKALIELQPLTEPLPTSDDDSSDTDTERRVRDFTRAADVWNLPEREKNSIQLNNQSQAIGKNYKKLVKFLGTLARNGDLAPLTHKNWKIFPKQNKKGLWQLIEKKFDIPSRGKKWTMKSLGKKWKDWKASLKKKHFDVNDVPGSYGNPPKRVLRAQWEFLVLYWSSLEAKKRSETYWKNRASQKFPHTTGTRSFAQIREDERAKRPDGSELERDFMFVTHKPTPGKPMAIGKDQHSHVRTYGLGPTRSDIWGKKTVNVEETTTLEPTTNEDNARLRNQVNVMEQKQKDMEAKLERYEQLEAKLEKYEQLEDKIKRYEQFLDMCTNHPQFLVQGNMTSGPTRVLETSNAPTKSLAPHRSYSSSSHGTRTTKETARKSATKSVCPH